MKKLLNQKGAINFKFNKLIIYFIFCGLCSGCSSIGFKMGAHDYRVSKKRNWLWFGYGYGYRSGWEYEKSKEKMEKILNR